MANVAGSSKRVGATFNQLRAHRGVTRPDDHGGLGRRAGGDAVVKTGEPVHGSRSNREVRVFCVLCCDLWAECALELAVLGAVLALQASARTARLARERIDSQAVRRRVVGALELLDESATLRRDVRGLGGNGFAGLTRARWSLGPAWRQKTHRTFEKSPGMTAPVVGATHPGEFEAKPSAK